MRSYKSDYVDRRQDYRPMFAYIRGSKMDELGKALDKAIQRTMESVWLGTNTAPLKEAVAWAKEEYGYGTVTEGEVREAIANYINLLVRALGIEPSSFTPLIDRELQRLQSTLIHNQPRLQPLQKEAGTLEYEVSRWQQRVAQAKADIKNLEALERQYKNRKKKLEAQEEEMRRFLEPTEQDAQERLAVMKSLAQSASDDLPVNG